MEQNLRFYEKAILEVNEDGVSGAWKASWGWPLMKQLSVRDARSVINTGAQYGLDPTIEMVCWSCNKRWNDHLNIADFFSSALAQG